MQKFLMKFLFVSVVNSLLLLSCGVQGAQATNRLGWTQDQQNIWNQLKNTNHPYYQKLVQEAGQYNYDDRGLRRGLMYLITGNVSYANSAWSMVDKWCGRTYQPPEVATNPSWCSQDWNGEPPNNGTRDQFLSLSLLYSWIADALPAQDKANFRDILDHWTDLVLNVNAVSHGTRGTDSDEQTGHYFGVVAYALAIRDEDPARSDQILNFAGNNNNGINTKPIGGVDATGANYNTQRNTIALFAQKALGGEWPESSEYNLTTVRYLLQGVHAINSFYGTDKFPEVTAMLADFDKDFLNQMTPDFRDSFQWGDVETPHNLKYFNRVTFMSVLSGITKDPRSLYLFDRFYNANFPTNTTDSWHYLADPYSTKSAPTGLTTHHAGGVGIGYYHEGWNPNDSFFATYMANKRLIDHDMAGLSNFALYRNGHWAIGYPVGYPGHPDQEAPYLNGLMIAGGVASVQEAKGETAYQTGNGYMYQAGATAGQLMLPGVDNPPLEFVREHNRSVLYLNHQDGSDSIVVFDRLNNCDPVDTTCMATWRFNNHPTVIKNRIIAAGSKTAWMIHMPDANPVINGNTITWNDEAGEQVTLKTFMTDYTSALYSETSGSGSPLYLSGSMAANQLKYQLRLSSNQKSGYQTFLNVLHAGGSIVTTQLNAISGEQAKGVLLVTGSENNAVIFNGNYSVPPAPSSVNGPPNGYSSTNDPLRLQKTKELRLFKSGFNMNILTLATSTKVYLMDLDPTKTWNFIIDGVNTSMTVSNQGVAIFNLSGSGDHTINVSNSGATNQPPVAVIANPTIVGQAVTLNGAGSYDPDGSIVSYSWNFGDGQTSTLANPSHTYATANNYTVTLTVSDGTLTGTTTRVISVGSINVAPVLSPIGDRSITGGNLLNFNVSVTDANGGPLTLSAQLTGGAALSTIGASFVDNGNGTGTFSWTPTVAQSGQYSIIFTTSDGQLTDTETITITVSSGAVESHWLETEYPSSIVSPMVVASNSGAANGMYMYNATSSIDSWTPDTKMATYTFNIASAGTYRVWGRIMGPTTNDDSFYVQMDNGTNNVWDVTPGTAWTWDLVADRGVADPVLFSLSAGQHTIKIKNRESGTKIDKILITSDAAYIPSGTGATAENMLVNHAPVAVIAAPVINFLSVSFNGSQSTDSDQNALTYLWNFGDGQTSTEVNPVHVYASAGLYNVTLTVSDGSLTDTDNVSVSTVAPNQPPVAVIASPVINGLSVQFNGSGSSDPDAGTTLTYLWNFGDGTTSTLANPLHNYAQKGPYTITLTVSDGQAQDSETVSVSLNRAPVAVIAPPVINNLTVSFDSNSTDPDGDLLTYLWNFGDGQTSTLKNPSHAYSAANSYAVTLTVSDGQATNAITTTVVVSQNSQHIWLEAENNSYYNSPMAEINDTTASGGQYIAVPNGAGDSWAPNGALASITFNVTQAGTYKFWGRVIASNGNNDSFFLRVDNGSYATWDVANGSSWHWDTMSDRGNGSIILNLSAGTHTIQVIRREDGTKLDKILITNDLNYTPTGVGQ